MPRRIVIIFIVDLHRKTLNHTLSMNIVVNTYTGKCIVRPDTTWEKDNEDFYPPEFVERISCTPVLFARVSKPGRSVGERFASRYYDAIGYGVLLYPENMLDGSEEGYACASCVDHTSFISFPGSEPSCLEGEAFTLSRGGEEIFSTTGCTRAMIEKAIAEVTKYVYIRTGDVIAIELSPRMPLLERKDGTVSVKGCFMGTNTIDFNVIF